MTKNILEEIVTKIYEIEKTIPFEHIEFEGIVEYNPQDEVLCSVTNTRIQTGTYYRINATLLIPIVDYQEID
jgi:hypothetical protein